MSYEVQSTTWFADSVLDGIVETTIDESCAIATMLALSFIILKVAYEWFRYSINSINDPTYAGRIIEWHEIVRIATLVLMIGLFPALATSVTGSIRWINSTTDKSSSTKAKMEEIGNDYYVQQKVAPAYYEMQKAKKMVEHFKHSGDSKKLAAAQKLYEDNQKKFMGANVNQNGTMKGRGGGEPVSEPSFWDLMSSGITGAIANILNLILGLIAMLIKWVVSGYARVIYKLLLIVGPLAIAVSVLWKDKFMGWFESLLNVGLVFYLMNVLDIIVFDYSYATVLNGTGLTSGKGGIGQSMSFNLVIIGAYLSIFRLTALWVGRNGIGSSIMNKGNMVVGVVAAGALMAVGALGGGSSAAGKGSAGASGGAGATGGTGAAGASAASKAGGSITGTNTGSGSIGSGRRSGGGVEQDED